MEHFMTSAASLSTPHCLLMLLKCFAHWNLESIKPSPTELSHKEQDSSSFFGKLLLLIQYDVILLLRVARISVEDFKLPLFEICLIFKHRDD